jgi:multiple sugar transport system substrate-binding protein
VSQANHEARALYADALAGRISRRELFTRGAALGVSVPVLAALAQEGMRRTLAAEEGKPTSTFYSWMIDLHPDIPTVGEELGVNVETAPTENFGFDRFVAEANEENSTWDSYGGVTPFLEMIALVDTGTIEPWDAYIPAELLDDFAPATRAEGTYNGQFYVWPLLLDICVQGWNADLVEQAGLDPTVAPTTWDEFIANARTVQESGVAPYGLTFDNRDWRSLIPVTHSISTDVYTPDGLFMYDSDAAIQALEILKQMMELANADVLAAAGVDNTVLVDEAAFASQQAAYYFKYQNAHLRNSAQWPDPTKLQLAKLPAPEGGVGGTVFWDTGAVLFKYGANKAKAVEFFTALAKDERIWSNSVTGNADEGILPAGQVPVLQSQWAAWEASPPEWLVANPWAKTIYDSLAAASAIAPCILAIKQFDVARPEWHKYLSGETADARTAGAAAMAAVRALFEAETGRPAQ